MRIDNYNNIFVFGLGKAGIAACNSLVQGGATVFAYDDRENIPEISGVTIIKPEDADWQHMDALVLSPGVPLTHPKPHIVVKCANNANCPIIGDVELLYRQVPDATYIGITGTNGKSTTTSLVGHILKHAGKPTEIGGNLGVPAVELEKLNEDGFYVIELSSYQLDLVDKFHVNYAVLLNITPDHIDRHGNFKNYIKSKLKIFDNQKENDVSVIGVDNKESRKIYRELSGHNIIPISSQEKQPGGVAVINEILYIDIGEYVELPIGYLKHLPGKHNAENIAASVAICYMAGVIPNDIINAIRTFPGLPHRLQWVTEKNDITYINDSKATNADSTYQALSAFKNIHWIVGGQEKEGGIKSLESLFKNVKHAYLIGQSQDEFAKFLEGKLPYTKCTTIKTAISAANKNATKGDQIILSPACASFDQYPNFEARGNDFIALL